MSETIGNITEELLEATMSNVMELPSLNTGSAVLCDAEEQPDLKPLSSILREVAQLAKNLQQGLEDVQIGDYKFSLTNASPLEIQLKRAISNLEVSAVEKPLKIIIKDEGDYEVKEDNLIPLEKVSNPGPIESSSSSSMPQNIHSPPLSPSNEACKTVNRDKKLTFGKRIRRLFRIGSKNPESNT